MQNYALQNASIKNSMAARVYDFLRGGFLINKDALKNWKFILFATFLALVMIYTGHSFERKVHYIAQLNDEVNELRSEYVDGQRQLMFLQMESTVASHLKETGIAPPQEPPIKVIVKTEN